MRFVIFGINVALWAIEHLTFGSVALRLQ